MNEDALSPRKRIVFSALIPPRLARPPFTARQEGGPERLAMAGWPARLMADRRKVLKQKNLVYPINPISLAFTSNEPLFPARIFWIAFFGGVLLQFVPHCTKSTRGADLKHNPI